MRQRGRRLRILLSVEPMLAVHAVRALHTALTGLDGIRLAEVSLGRAVLHYEGDADDESLTHALRSLVEVVGLQMTSCRIEPDRQLPLAGNAR